MGYPPWHTDENRDFEEFAVAVTEQIPEFIQHSLFSFRSPHRKVFFDLADAFRHLLGLFDARCRDEFPFDVGICLHRFAEVYVEFDRRKILRYLEALEIGSREDEPFTRLLEDVTQHILPAARILKKNQKELETMELTRSLR